MERPEAGDDNPSSPRRISVAAARRMLGMVGRNYSDEDMAEILDCLYGISEEAFEIYQAVELSTRQESEHRPDSDE